MERQLYFPRNEGTRRRRHSDIFSQDMRGPIAALGRLRLGRFAVAAFGHGRSVNLLLRLAVMGRLSNRETAVAPLGTTQAKANPC